MNKFQRFLRRHLISIFLVVVTVALLLSVYFMCHAMATAERCYDAIGGEIFVFAIPAIIYAIIDTRRCIKDAKDRK